MAFSGRGSAPEGEPSPTAFLARRLARALGLPDLPIARATQVHAAGTLVVKDSPPGGEVLDAGEGDILVTASRGVALAVQTADCVPLLLAGDVAIAAVHAGWRGSLLDVAGAAARALSKLGAPPENLRAWMGPTIGLCCYKVGEEVAERFAGDFLRNSHDGGFRLDLAAVNRSQLEAAGVAPENISIHPACTMCGGERFASYRRDGAAAGRMIALIVRLSRG